MISDTWVRKNQITFTYNHFIGIRNLYIYTPQVTAAAYVIYVSLEVAENPTKRKTNPFR